MGTILRVIQLLTALAVAALEYVRQVPPPPADSTTFPDVAVLWLQHRQPVFTLLLAVMFAASGFMRGTVRSHRYVKSVHRRLLNQVLKDEFDDDARRARITVFRQVTGLHALAIFIYRWMRFEEERLRVLPMFPWAVWGKYLIVHVRCERGHNKASVSMFRVFVSNESRCESIAGKIWSLDSGIFRDLPLLVDECERYRSSTRRTRRSNPAPEWLRALRSYVNEWKLRSIRQLCAIKRQGRHFMGTVIWSPAGDKWGMILVDSSSADCPFPDDDDKAKAMIDRYSHAIGHTLPEGQQ